MAETATAERVIETKKAAEPKPAAVGEKKPVPGAVKAAPIPAPPEDVLERVPTADLKPSPTNPRKFFGQASLRELADSLAGVGMLQPIVARRNGKGYEIVAGERRWRAAQMAGLAKVPVVVRVLSDEQVLRVQLVENKQREDTTALEEARGYRALMKFDPKKYTAAAIGAMIGLSEKYVWDRMKLLDLVPEAQAILDQGLMTAGHAILIARLKPDQQAKVIKVPKRNSYGPDRESGLWTDEDDGPWDHERPKRLIDVLDDSPEAKYQGYKAKSVRELDDWIGNHFRFDPAHAAAAAPLLFAGVKAQVDAAEAKTGRRKKWVYITHRHLADDSVRKDGGERVYGEQSWRRADGERDHEGKASKTCDRSTLGVIGAGPVFNDERAFTVCVDRDCKVHFKKERRVSAPAPKPPKAAAPGASEADRKRAAEQERKYQEEQRQRAARRQAFQKILPALIDSIGEEIKAARMSTVLPIAEKTLDYNLSLAEPRRMLGFKGKGCATAEDLARLIAAEEFCNGVELSLIESAEDLARNAKPWGAGIPALAKKLQASAPKPKPAAGKKPAKKPAKKASRKK